MIKMNEKKNNGNKQADFQMTMTIHYLARFIDNNYYFLH